MNCWLPPNTRRQWWSITNYICSMQKLKRNIYIGGGQKSLSLFLRTHKTAGRQSHWEGVEAEALSLRYAQQGMTHEG
jgi:hypothetical protein